MKKHIQKMIIIIIIIFIITIIIIIIIIIIWLWPLDFGLSMWGKIMIPIYKLY